jgi:hypothetical protein
MPLKKGLVGTDIFHPHHAFAQLQADDAVHQQKGVAMREKPLNFIYG